MPTKRITQTSWSAGEIDRVAEGRPDTQLYSAGARTLRNALPLVTGGFKTRPGSVIELIGDTSERRLFSFFFNALQRYLVICTTSSIAVRVINTDDSLGAACTVTNSGSWSTWLSGVKIARAAGDEPLAEVGHPDLGPPRLPDAQAAAHGSDHVHPVAVRRGRNQFERRAVADREVC